MPGVIDERAPLLQFPGPSMYQASFQDVEELPDAYKQFCHLVGNRPADHPVNKSYHPPKDTLYYRALEHRKSQSIMYAFTSALTNTLLLSQVVLGAALTGLGASESSPLLITVFGALNTIIAGLIAFLKSRGQPMRARMFRDDLDRVVDEIENSATMWRGISQKIHGYDAIDTDEAVTVRSEVARLTRLYDRAVKTSTMNDPDFYGAGVTSDHATSGLRNRAGQPLIVAPPQPEVPAVVGPAVPSATPVAAIAHPSVDVDESPATKAPAPTPLKPAEEPTTSTPAGPPTSDAQPSASQPSASQPSASQPSISQPSTSPSSDNPPAQNAPPAEQPAASIPAAAPPAASTSNSAPSAPAPAPAPAPPPVSAAFDPDPDASPATAHRPPQSERTKSRQSTKVTEDLSHSSLSPPPLPPPPPQVDAGATKGNV